MNGKKVYVPYEEGRESYGTEKKTQRGSLYQIPSTDQCRYIEEQIGTESDGKRAVGYIRVSTLGQASSDRFGMDEQRDIITKYCDDHGLQLMGWYIDSGVSGTAESRPAMDSLLYNGLKYPAISYVVCAKSDRMARDIKLYYYYLMLLEKKGIELVSATEELVNDSTGLGEIYKSLMLFVAEQERKNITMRTSGGRNQKARTGGYAGGKTPFGYRAVGGQLEIDPKEADIVRKVFFLYVRGMSANAITSYLNQSGARGRAGTWLATSTIINILKREKLYRGYYQYGSSGWVKGKHEPILTDDDLGTSPDDAINSKNDYPKVMYRIENQMAIEELKKHLQKKFEDEGDTVVNP